MLIWCGNLIPQKDLHHVYLILRNLLYLIVPFSFGHFYSVNRFLFSSCHNKRPPMILFYHRRPIFAFYRLFFIVSCKMKTEMKFEHRKLNLRQINKLIRSLPHETIIVEEEELDLIYRNSFTSHLYFSKLYPNLIVI